MVVTFENNHELRLTVSVHVKTDIFTTGIQHTG